MGCIKKISVLLLSIILCFSMIACNSANNVDENKKIDNTKAQLNVFNYDGGFGHAWLDSVIERFTELHKDTVYQEGTKGVQIWTNNKKISGEAVITQVPKSKDNVFFVENLNYLNYVYSGVMMDITDLVQEPLTEYGETCSIEDKLVQQQKDYYNVKTLNNGVETDHYYALPHFEGFNGISYDVDLFNKNNLFFKDDGTIGCKSTGKNISAGIDNIKGTFDDGLPRTFDEFFELCDKMKSIGIIPLNWSGYYQFYFACMMTALTVDYAGEEGLMFYDFDGITKELISSIDANTGEITFKEPTAITVDNGYEMYKHAGLYYALKFCETIIKNGYCSDNSFHGTKTNEDAQDDFLLSRFESGGTPIGMLVEGDWWTMEADKTFKIMENTYINSGKYERKLGFMPLPKANEEKLAEHQSYLKDDNYALRFINANCPPERIKLAKDFLRFCCTDLSFAEFNKLTGATLGYDYSVNEEDLNNMTYFAQSVYDLRKHSKVIYPYTSKDFFYKNKSDLVDFFNVKKYTQPTRAIKDDNVSALKYFELVNNKFSKEIWETMK